MTANINKHNFIKEPADMNCPKIYRQHKKDSL
jgi:hypothetical protein